MGVFGCLRSVVAEYVILEQFGVISRRWTFNVRFCWISRFQAETLVFDCLRSVEGENVILERFGVISRRSTFNVRLSWISRFRAETRVFDCLRSVVAENVILDWFGVISRRWTFNVRFCSMSRFRFWRFYIPTQLWNATGGDFEQFSNLKISESFSSPQSPTG